MIPLWLFCLVVFAAAVLLVALCLSLAENRRMDRELRGIYRRIDLERRLKQEVGR